MQRLFVGVGLPDPVRDEIERSLTDDRVRAREPSGLRWLPSHNWHVTLQFLGHVADDAVAGVRSACADAARATPAFTLEFGAAGAFGSPRRARVVWIGLAQGHAEVAALAEALFARTEPLGFAREEREFRSHITVARLKTPSDVSALLAALRVPALTMPVTALTLYRSHLSSKGADYEPLAGFPLG